MDAMIALDGHVLNNDLNRWALALYFRPLACMVTAIDVARSDGGLELKDGMRTQMAV